MNVITTGPLLVTNMPKQPRARQTVVRGSGQTARHCGIADHAHWRAVMCASLLDTAREQ